MKVNKISLLDCTLRDGGYVNNFNFGQKNITEIVEKLNKSNVEFIELGFLKDGDHDNHKTLFNFVNQAERFIVKNTAQKYTMMIRPDWYNINQLQRGNGLIDTVRFAFHLKDLKLTLKQADYARALGYNIFLNPVVITSYKKNELDKLLSELNSFEPLGVCIVDTFGSLLPSDLKHVYESFSSILKNEITIGLHLHENLSISLALTDLFLEMVGNSRNICIDSSVNGIGRIPGNLCTELIMNYLNLNCSKNYNLSPVYELIDNPISKIKSQNNWGYLPAYAITGYYKIHRSYAEHLSKIDNLSLVEINNLLLSIPEKNKGAFNEKLINDIYKTRSR